MREGVGAARVPLLVRSRRLGVEAALVVTQSTSRTSRQQSIIYLAQSSRAAVVEAVVQAMPEAMPQMMQSPVAPARIGRRAAPPAAMAHRRADFRRQTRQFQTEGYGDRQAAVGVLVVVVVLPPVVTSSKHLGAPVAQQEKPSASERARLALSTTAARHMGRHRDACAFLFSGTRSCILWGVFDGARTRSSSNGVAE